MRKPYGIDIQHAANVNSDSLISVKPEIGATNQEVLAESYG